MFVIALLNLAGAAAGFDAPYYWSSDTLFVPLKSGLLKLQVYSPDIVRVRYLPTGSKPDVDLPVIIGKPQPAKWTKAFHHPSIVELKTAKVSVLVNTKTGLLRFLDAKGQSVLSELPVSRIKNGAATGRFALSPGEGIYGLGQHQQGLMNYRGSKVKLEQENREIAVPMLLSSKGYGLLWNNPSAGLVDAAGGDEMIVPSSMLSQEDGTLGGLTARYYKGKNFEQLVKTEPDSSIDHVWTNTPPAGLDKTNYSVRWSGFITAPKTGDYTFIATGDDGIRLKIDGKTIIEDWASRPEVTVRKKIHLNANHPRRIEFDYYQDGYDATVHLGISTPPKSQDLVWTSGRANRIDYVFFYGPDLERVIAGYRELTGKAPMFGRWAWGLWQSRERYKTQDELIDVADCYRNAKIPLDGIIQDWQYWIPDGWGSHIFDPARYPDPAAAVAKLHSKHVHTLISVWPKFVTGSETQKTITAAGAMLKPPIPYQGHDEQWYDPSGKVGRKTYWGLVASHIAKFGWDGWWLDASEPELGARWGEFRDYQTAVGPAALIYNAFPFLHTMGVYQGQRALTDKRRSIILTRSAYAGQQRNGAIAWSGDINASWAVLQAQIPAGLNFSLSGIPYWNTDTGGFFAYQPIEGAEYQDMFARWFQFSTFVPMLRIHGTGVAKEIWRWPEPTRSNLIKFDRLRYHLLPYIYSTSWAVTNRNSTMMRALVLDFREDPKARDLTDEYMFGPNLLVAPVTTPKTKSRSVYLPKGADWIDFWTGETYRGGQSVDADAVGKEPIFARSGAILPYGPEVQSAEDREDPTEIRIYPGADGEYTLYNDQGDGYAYEKGAYTTIKLRWNDRTRTLSVGGRSGSYPGMPVRRNFRVVVVKPGKGVGVPSAKVVDRVVSYGGRPMSVRL